MAGYVAGDVIKTMLKRKQRVESARVLVMGFTFKENCPTRATPRWPTWSAGSTIWSPRSSFIIQWPTEKPQHEFGIAVSAKLPLRPFDAIVLAVKHDQIMKMGESSIPAHEERLSL